MTCKRQSRDSGIELLRMLAAMGVVLLHYNDGRAFEYVEPNSGNMYLLYFLESLCICSVDLFLLISGYFLSVSNKRNYIKPVELIVQTSVFNLLSYGWYILRGATVTISGLFLTIVPANYFVILYSCLYIISPYLNKIFRGFDAKQWKHFMIVFLLLFAVYPIWVDFFKEITGRAWEGLSPISRTGNSGGFNIVNFCLLYAVGAYLRYNRIPRFIHKHLLWLYISVITALIFMWSLFNSTMELTELCSAWCYHNPLVILLAALLFCAFKDLKFKSYWINELAGASFTCFLFQWYLLRVVNIQKYVTGDAIHMILHIVYTMVMAYMTSYIAYKIWGGMTNWIFQKIEQYAIKEF